MSFSDETFSGGILVQASARSPIYVPGVSGWSINDDGSAEFNNVAVRGELLVSNANGSRVWIHNQDNTARVDLRPANSADPNITFVDAKLVALAEGFSADQAEVKLESPRPVSAINPAVAGTASVALVSESHVGDKAQALITAEEVRVGTEYPAVSLIHSPSGLKYPVMDGGLDNATVIGAAATSVVSGTFSFNAALTDPDIFARLTNTSGLSRQWTGRVINIDLVNHTFQIFYMGPAPGTAFTVNTRWVALDAL